MTFGLRNATQTFQRYLNAAIGDLNFAFVYIDDILVASENQEEHAKHLDIICKKLKEFSLTINLEKCIFGAEKLDFLGHEISGEGFKPTAEKTEIIKNFPKPKTIDQLRRFLGIINFYRRCIPKAANMQMPLQELLKDCKKKDTRPVVWNAEAETAFEKCKHSLLKITYTAFLSEDAEIRLVTDASDIAMGAALEQKADGKWKPLAFFSRKFSQAQKKYSTFDRELTAIYEALKYFRYFVEGREFVIYTDHLPLTYALDQAHDK